MYICCDVPAKVQGNMVGDDHELDSKDMVGHRMFLSWLQRGPIVATLICVGCCMCIHFFYH